MLFHESDDGKRASAEPEILVTCHCGFPAAGKLSALIGPVGSPERRRVSEMEACATHATSLSHLID